MPTKISADYSKEGSSFEEPDNFKNPFYCKEGPYEVMEKLADRFLIKKFKNIESKVGSSEIIWKDRSKSNQHIIFNGLKLEEYFPGQEGIEITGKIQNYNPEFPENDINEDMKNTIISALISDYLISTKEISPGHKTIGPGGREIGAKQAKQKVINYFKTRVDIVDYEKETYLFEILEYSQALLGKKFLLRDLKKLARKVEKETPRKVESHNVFFATLKPSNYIRDTMFSKGPNIR